MEPFSKLIQSDTPVLVDFYADWCGPCKSMEPVVRDVARQVDGKTKIIKVNIDRNNATAQAFGVQAVPTFILFKNGKVMWRQAGMIDKGSLLSAISRFS